MTKLAIVTGPQPDQQVRFAADELKRYVSQLFGATAVISPHALPAESVVFLDADAAGLQNGDRSLLRESPGGHSGQKSSDPFLGDEQTFLLRRLTRNHGSALAAVGGSPVATLWAVYELVEHWGVRYLLHGDIFPENAGDFHLPDVNETFSPNLRSRCWRLINDLACGPESWGLEENIRFIDQLTKLKFNEIFIAFYAWQSYVHYEFRGVQKQTGESWFGYRYGIDEETVGREIFAGASEFENPDLAGITDYQERYEAARLHAQGILRHARLRGMKTGISVPLLEYPLEFQPQLPGAQIADQLGFRTCGPGDDQDPYDPVLCELVRTIIRNYVETYPEADSLYLGVPEHRAWMNRAQDAWERLDAKFGISEVMSLEDAVADAEKRPQVFGGVERQVSRIKADIVALSLLDSVLDDDELLARPGRPPIRVIYNGVAEELWPILPRILPENGGLHGFIDYTARRVVEQIETMDYASADKLACRMIFTLADDNVGLLPQLSTIPLAEIASRMRERQWEGFTTRHWLIGDLDPTVQYLARSSWNGDVSPSDAMADLAATICNSPGAESLVESWNLIEEVTAGFSDYGLGYAFPTERMMTKHWEGSEANPIVGDCVSEAILQSREKYVRAQQLAREAATYARPAGKHLLVYLVGRLQFGIRYIDTTEALLKAGIAERSGKRPTAIQELQSALAAIREAIQAYANVAADNSDRGAIAILNENSYRRISSLLKELTET